MSTRIRAIPATDRPRERLWAKGPDALSDVELLALVIRSGHRGESVLELAASLLTDHGGIFGLAGARPEELTSRAGVGPAKAAAVVAALRLARRIESGAPPKTIRSAGTLAELACAELADLRRERTVVIVLDPGHRLRRLLSLTEGSVDRSLLPVREVLNLVLRNDGRAFAVAHNHPSGDAAPSAADVQSTRDLAAAAKLVGLRFLDHVIVAGETWTSLRQAGALD